MAPGQKSHGWGLALAVTVVGAFMAILDTSIVNVAIPHIMVVFGVSQNDVQWIVTIYMLALGVVVPISGWLGDTIGLKRLYIGSLLVFTLGSALSAFAPSLDFLIGARVLQALGGGMIMPTTMSMVFQMVPRDRIGTAMGFWGLSLLLAPAIGPTVGGYLVEYVDWRWIFTINIPIGILGSIAAAAWLHEFPRHRAGRLDWPGALSAAIGLFALLFALTEGQTWGWTSEGIVYLLYASFVALAFFIFWELYGTKQPLLDLRVFRYRSFTASIIAMVILTIGMFSALFFIPIFLQNLRGLSPFQTGLIMMPGALASGLMMPLAGRIYDRIGPKLPGIIGFIVLAAGTYLLHEMTSDVPTGFIVLLMVIRGFGMGLAMMPLMTGGMSVVPQALISRASAIQNIMQRVAGAFGIAALTEVMLVRQSVYIEAMRDAVTPASPAIQQLLQGGQQALLYLWDQIQIQSLVRAMDDVFVISAALIVLAIAAVFFVRRHVVPGEHHQAMAPMAE